ATEIGPAKGPIEVNVRVKRNGYNGDVGFVYAGLPYGVQTPGYFVVRGGTDEATVTLTPVPAGIFQKRGPKEPSGPAEFPFPPLTSTTAAPKAPRGPGDSPCPVCSGGGGEGRVGPAPPVKMVVTR